MEFIIFNIQIRMRIFRNVVRWAISHHTNNVCTFLCHLERRSPIQLALFLLCLNDVVIDSKRICRVCIISVWILMKNHDTTDSLSLSIRVFIYAFSYDFVSTKETKCRDKKPSHRNVALIIIIIMEAFPCTQNTHGITDITITITIGTWNIMVITSCLPLLLLSRRSTCKHK